MIQIDLPQSWVQSGDPTTVNDASPHAKGQLGGVVRVKNSTLFSPGNANRPYMYVQRSATDTVTPAVGQIAYWKDLDTFVVTTDVSDSISGTLGVVAGFFPSASLVAGNYGFIQVGGVGPVLLKTSPTATAAAGSVIFVEATPADATCDAADNFADAAAVANAGLIVAQALSAKNAGSIGTHVVEALIFPARLGL
jgi:hypothetical protein